jgi:hypothetical protein
VEKETLVNKNVLKDSRINKLPFAVLIGRQGF